MQVITVNRKSLLEIGKGPGNPEHAHRLPPTRLMGRIHANKHSKGLVAQSRRLGKATRRNVAVKLHAKLAVSFPRKLERSLRAAHKVQRLIACLALTPKGKEHVNRPRRLLRHAQVDINTVHDRSRELAPVKLDLRGRTRAATARASEPSTRAIICSRDEQHLRTPRNLALGPTDLNHACLKRFAHPLDHVTPKLGSSSRNSTPPWASEISPGCSGVREPPAHCR